MTGRLVVEMLDIEQPRNSTHLLPSGRQVGAGFLPVGDSPVLGLLAMPVWVGLGCGSGRVTYQPSDTL